MNILKKFFNKKIAKNKDKTAITNNNNSNNDITTNLIKTNSKTKSIQKENKLSFTDNDFKNLPYINNLNDEQIKAMNTTEGYVRVIAGAGTGKTKTLISRYMFLVDNLQIPMQNILCVTFTNKAANEMKHRIQNYGKDIDLAYICTFHGFCTKVLREEYGYIQHPKNFIIIDRSDQKLI